MNSFVVSQKNITGKIISIDDPIDLNHLKNVLRLKEGDKIRVVDGEREYFCDIKTIEKKTAVLSIEETNGDKYSLNVKIDAAIGVIKNERMDLVIQKLTEIGINTIIPVETKRTIIKLDGKKEKWDKVSKEALKQCKGVKFVKIEELKKIKEIKLEDYDIVFVPYENEENKTIRAAIKEIKEKGKKIEKIIYLIGPEGGFDREEIEYLSSKNGVIVSLGARILRAETAAVVMGGILANEFE